MTPGQYNLICPQGATFSKRLTWTSDDLPINLSGYTAAMQVREKYSSASAILSLSTSNGGITLGGALGTIDIYISDEATAAVYAKDYVYDLELYSGGETTRLIQGKFIVTPEVTR